MEESSNITPEPSLLTTGYYHFPMAVQMPAIGHPHLMLPWLTEVKSKADGLVSCTPAPLLCSLMNETAFLSSSGPSQKKPRSTSTSTPPLTPLPLQPLVLSISPLLTLKSAPFSIPIFSAIGHTLIIIFPADTYERLLPSPSLGSLLP